MTERQIYKKLSKIVSKYTSVPLKEITPSSNVKSELGLSSFDLATVLWEIEDTFSVSLSESDVFQRVSVVQDMVDLISGKL